MPIELSPEEIKALVYIVGLSCPMTLRKKNETGKYLPHDEMEKVCDMIHPLFDKFNAFDT